MLLDIFSLRYTYLPKNISMIPSIFLAEDKYLVACYHYNNIYLRTIFVFNFRHSKHGNALYFIEITYQK